MEGGRWRGQAGGVVEGPATLGSDVVLAPQEDETWFVCDINRSNAVVMVVADEFRGGLTMYE